MLKTMASRLGLLGLEPHVAKQFYPPPANCVLYLPGYPPQGAKIIDHSGQGNDGTIDGSTWVRLPSGLWAQNDDGDNDVVDCGDDTSLQPVKLTVESWLLVANSDTDNYDAPISNLVSEHGYEIFQVLGSRQLNADAYFVTTGRVNVAIGTPALNTWCYCAFACDGTSMIVVFNGSLVSTNDAVGDVTYNSPHGSLKLGYNQNTGGWWKGRRALTRIYSQAKTLSYLQGHYNQERHLLGV